MDYLQHKTSLRKRYFILRHGESLNKVKNILQSDVKKGLAGFGLTAVGKKQIEVVVKKFTALDQSTIIYASDFKRTRETAAIARRILKTRPVHFSPLLRERGFGRWNEVADYNYQKIEQADLKNPHNQLNGIESLNHVLNRTTKLVDQLEKKYTGKKILLVSHGDPLQILQTGFMKLNANQHRRRARLRVAQLRELKLKKSPTR